MSELPVYPFSPALLARLKIRRSDVNFGYRTVGGSERVYKIELNGKVHAAKVSYNLDSDSVSVRHRCKFYQYFCFVCHADGNIDLQSLGASQREPKYCCDGCAILFLAGETTACTYRAEYYHTKYETMGFFLVSIVECSKHISRPMHDKSISQYSISTQDVYVP